MGAVVAALVLGLLAAGPADAQRKQRFKLTEATIAEIRSALRTGTVSCVELTRLYLKRIDAYEDGGLRLNAITTVNPRAVPTARRLDRQLRRRGPSGPLHCIPTLLKDNVDTFDMPTSNGSVILQHAMAPDDAFIAARLRAEGALILGKASMGEFAGGSYNTIDGQVTNPYNVRRDTGGSSAGSGAALAANLAVLAIGTDTSTSVRGPASYNGLVGLRPTTGLISRDGIAPKNLTFDTAGPMARTVRDAALMMNAVVARDTADPLSVETFGEYPGREGRRAARGRLDYTSFLHRRSLRGARIGVVRDFFGGDPEIDALAERALRVLRRRGARLVEVQLDPAFLDFYVANGGTNVRRIADYRFKAEWEAYLATFDASVPKTVEDFIRIYETEVNRSARPVEDSVLNLLKRSQTTSTADPRFQDLVNRVLPAATEYKLSLFRENDLDALVFPYETAFASPIDNPVFSIPDPSYVESDVPASSIFAGYSSVGFPGIVVPMGFGSEGLPMTLSFMGRPYDEGKILGYAYDYEQATELRAPSPLTPALPGETIRRRR